MRSKVAVIPVALVCLLAFSLQACSMPSALTTPETTTTPTEWTGRSRSSTPSTTSTPYKPYKSSTRSTVSTQATYNEEPEAAYDGGGSSEYIQGVPLSGTLEAATAEFEAVNKSAGVSVMDSVYDPDILYPGSTIYSRSQYDPEATWLQCTLASIVEYKGRTYGITAAHCLFSKGEPYSHGTIHWGDPNVANELRYAVGQTSLYVYETESSIPPSSLYDVDKNPKTAKLDVGAFEIDTNAVPIGNRAGNAYVISGWLSINELTKDTVVCKLGSRTWETCGKIISASGSRFAVNLYSISGDSGSLAYVKQPDGTIKGVGILHGSPSARGDLNDSITYFTPIDRINNYMRLVL